MKKLGNRTSPAVSSANDSHDPFEQSNSIASDMEKALAAHFDRTAVQPRDNSLYDQISSIINGTKSTYSSVEDAVKDMQERSGFSAHAQTTNNYFEQKKLAQTQDNAQSNEPNLFQANPKIKDTFDNYITDTRGNVSVPAVMERVKNIHKRDVDDDSLWNDDKLIEYISNKCEEQKQSHPDTDDFQQGLGKMTNFNDSDMDISNTDALHALSPVKASPLISILAGFDSPPKDVKSKDLDWLDEEDRKQLKDWGTKEEVEGNPPKWAAEPSRWKRAKKTVKKYWKNYKEPYAVVAWLYHKQMGGKLKKHKKKKG